MGLSTKYTAIMRRAASIAVKNSSHKQHRLCCVIIRGGNIISVGWNNAFVHGEHSALNRAWENGTIGAIAVVVRVKKDGSFGIAKPCPLCLERLKSAGIKRVIYTDIIGVSSINLSNELPFLKKGQLEYHFVKPVHKPKIINNHAGR